MSVVGDTRGVALDFGMDHPLVEDLDAVDAVIAFAANTRELDGMRDLLLAAVQRDALTWVAYPKAGQLGTDLNRDSRAVRMQADGMRPVRGR